MSEILSSSVIDVSTSLGAFFRAELSKSLVAPTFTQERVTYLAQLLSSYVNNHTSMAGEDSAPSAVNESRASPVTHNVSQVSDYKRIGDHTLYILSFFKRSDNGLIARDTLSKLGATSYRFAAEHSRDFHTQNLYQGLAQDYSVVLTALTEVAERLMPVVLSDRDLLELCGLWLRSPDDRTRKLLNSAGIQMCSISGKRH